MKLSLPLACFSMGWVMAYVVTGIPMIGLIALVFISAFVIAVLYE